MFGLRTKPVRTAVPSPHGVRHRSRLGLEVLEPRDVPSSFAAPMLAASVVNHYPPNRITPHVELVSVSAVHRYPPQPI